MYDKSIVLHSVLTSCLGISSQAKHMVLSPSVELSGSWLSTSVDEPWKFPQHLHLCWSKHFFVAFRKPFPGKNLFTWDVPCYPISACTNGVVLSGFETNKTLWSSPLELVTVNIPSSSLMITFHVLKRLIAPLNSGWWQIVVFHVCNLVQWTCRRDTGLTVCNSGRGISDVSGRKLSTKRVAMAIELLPFFWAKSCTSAVCWVFLCHCWY